MRAVQFPYRGHLGPVRAIAATYNSCIQTAQLIDLKSTYCFCAHMH
eukprot:COSAG01_NODE_56039_length_321_cov_0.662162_1_plen_45_part_10